MTIDKKTRHRILFELGPCRICRATSNLTIDHIRPIAEGGSDHRKNLQPLCQSCNTKKADSWDGKSGWPPPQDDRGKAQQKFHQSRQVRVTKEQAEAEAAKKERIEKDRIEKKVAAERKKKETARQSRLKRACMLRAQKLVLNALDEQRWGSFLEEEGVTKKW